MQTDIKLIGIWNDSASDTPLFDGLPLIGNLYEGHLDPHTNNSWLVKKASNSYWRCPKEFLMPLYEWRDKRIDQILEDG